MESRFLGETARAITPYVPGEQPQDQQYIKLNTNECPYPPSPLVQKALAGFDYDSLRLYPDPDVRLLCREMASAYSLPEEMVFAGGGSDELLGYAFMAFFNRGDPVYFPDITYGFYQVYADLCGLAAREIPLREDFTVNVQDYLGLDGSIVIANPNAPTGIALPREEIVRILRANPDRLVLVDEAYADFGDCSSVNLVPEYDNLLVVQTFSKSRSLAGMRIAFAFGQPHLIDGLNRIKYSFNPYNIDRVSIDVGIAAIRDVAYTREITARVTATRNGAAKRLGEMGFTVLPSQTNFLFASRPDRGGEELYLRLRERGILVRHFKKPRIADFLRITIGTGEQMEKLIAALTGIIL